MIRPCVSFTSAFVTTMHAVQKHRKSAWPMRRQTYSVSRGNVADARAERLQQLRGGHLQVAGENELIGSRDADEPGGCARHGGRLAGKHGRANGQRARQHDDDDDDV